MVQERVAEALETGIRNARNVGRYIYSTDAIGELDSLVASRRDVGPVAYLIDEYFAQSPDPLRSVVVNKGDILIYVPTENEPTTTFIDELVRTVKNKTERPSAIIGIGGGITLDCAKAASNLLGNGGLAADYQGWDLVPGPGIYKIGVPTISGTGAEATRTCVMTNEATGLKLGMNSDFTVFDQLILDPNLSMTVPRDQYFFTGMDSYIHCVESLDGRYRNPIGDAYSDQALRLCRQVFDSEDMMSDENRSKLMIASYLGGCAIAMSYVGLVHPLSAALSVVFGFHHCIANCIVMTAMADHYPAAFSEFSRFCESQNVVPPKGICHGAADSVFDRLYQATLIHEKPLINKFGEEFRKALSEEKVKRLFEAM